MDKIGSMKDVLGEPVFKNLAAVMKGILTIPHSSAHCECVFSCVRKNRTEQRASLGDDTLEALLVIKAQPGTALEEAAALSDNTLKDLKSCYYRSLKTDSEPEQHSASDSNNT